MADQKTLVIERVFDAPVERVWRAWTDAQELGKWWGPEGFVSPDNRVDFRVGGKCNLSMQATGEIAKQIGDQVMYSGGVYKEIVEHKKIVYTDGLTDKDGNRVPPEHYGMPADFPGELEVWVEFEELPDGKTKITLTHLGMQAGESEEQAGAGWKSSFNKLAESLKS